MFERARAKQNTLTLLAFFWLVFCHPYYLCWELFGFKSCNLKTECYLYVKLLLYHYYKIHQHMLIWLLLQYAHCCNNINQLFYKIIYIYKTFNNVYTTDLSLQQFFLSLWRRSIKIFVIRLNAKTVCPLLESTYCKDCAQYIEVLQQETFIWPFHTHVPVVRHFFEFFCIQATLLIIILFHSNPRSRDVWCISFLGKKITNFFFF